MRKLQNRPINVNSKFKKKSQHKKWNDSIMLSLVREYLLWWHIKIFPINKEWIQWMCDACFVFFDIDAKLNIHGWWINNNTNKFQWLSMVLNWSNSTDGIRSAVDQFSLVVVT